MALVTLLAHTPQPELHVAAAAKLCYSPSSIDKIKEHTGQRFLDKLHRWLEEVTDVKGL